MPPKRASSDERDPCLCHGGDECYALGTQLAHEGPCDRPALGDRSICSGCRNRPRGSSASATADPVPDDVSSSHPKRRRGSTSRRRSSGASAADVPDLAAAGASNDIPDVLRSNAALVASVLPFIGDTEQMADFQACARGAPTQPEPTDAELAGADFYGKRHVLNGTPRDFIAAVRGFFRPRDPWPQCEALLLDAMQASPMDLGAVNDVHAIRLVAAIGPAWLKKSPEQRAQWLGMKLEQHGEQLLGSPPAFLQLQQSALGAIPLGAPVHEATDASREEAALLLGRHLTTEQQQQASPLRCASAVEDLDVPSIPERTHADGRIKTAEASSPQAAEFSPSLAGGSRFNAVANLHAQQVTAPSERAETEASLERTKKRVRATSPAEKQDKSPAAVEFSPSRAGGADRQTTAPSERVETEVSRTDITETTRPGTAMEDQVALPVERLPHSSSAASVEQEERQASQSSPGPAAANGSSIDHAAKQADKLSQGHQSTAEQEAQARAQRLQEVGNNRVEAVNDSSSERSKRARAASPALDSADGQTRSAEINSSQAAERLERALGASSSSHDVGDHRQQVQRKRATPAVDSEPAKRARTTAAAESAGCREFAAPAVVPQNFERWLDRKQYPDAAFFVVQQAKRILEKNAVGLLEKHHVFTDGIGKSGIQKIRAKDPTAIPPKQFADQVEEGLNMLKEEYAGRENLC